MTKEKRVESWRDFLDLFSMVGGESSKRKSLLFRGQADSQWKLQTTLERRGCYNVPIVKYYNMLARIIPNLETFTGKSWQFDITGYEEESFVTRGLSNPDYLVYLRHYGFPSPLLDWTRSPFIAAFFCCSNNDEADGVVFEYTLDSNSKIVTLPGLNVNSVGPYIAGEKRHFVQQAEYLWAFNKNDDGLFFAEIDNALSGFNGSSLKKIIIPSSLKKDFLIELDFMNINAFSLYGTQESLLDDAFRKEKKVLR
ncbi:FRG domain-containing protein [Pseudodesulfovibrio sp. F-1]|uniref:FRG domain-containing protein n=1 Tax=Pseudodesulfovibrio alkaliphilus TaxID=2661613 RepID=A0A7K1KJK3_9BACT|nr:FRG domain-containing protein [Pseudodesulfovibrio alkaliphilus]MUM76246.1 FRG domain-containing protein [Pseudodesulfovibrio alkaliphilus]